MKTTLLKILHIALSLVATGVFASCTDDFFADIAAAGEGESDVILNVSFDSYSQQGAASRAGTPGDTIGQIDELCVLAYSMSGSLVSGTYHMRDVSLVDGTVKLSLPYGRYRIYVLANMGDVTRRPEAATEETMRHITFAWDSADMARNSQMWGAVTESAAQAVANRIPPVVTIGAGSSTLYAGLHRAVSKATIAYDATALNDNVFIYIVSAQVRDIPLSCTAVSENVPQLPDGGGDNIAPALCLTQGQTVNYLDGDDPMSSRVVLAKGSAYGGLRNEDELHPGENVHTDDEESLFFYENMQGTHPNKHLYNNFPSKDNVVYGSYLEVKAYYVNKSANNPSKGYITYRYMLGMNDTDDFNARRNTHYKVTLRFVGDANNPDWHIEYSRPTVPTVEVPTPLHISYLYNQRLDVPVICYYDNTNYYVKSVEAKILENPYTHPAHKYASLSNVSFGGNTYNWTDNRYGFLSLNNYENITSIDMTVPDAYLGETTVPVPDPADYDPSVKGLHLSIPVYTRPLNLMVPQNGNLTDLGFSGNNHFTHRERKAKLRVTVVFGSLANSSYTTSSSTDIEILQTKRVVNPKGCWRPAGSTKPFTFTIMETDKDATNISSVSESAVDYTPIRSAGPWTARVYTENYHGSAAEFKPGVDWIEISPKGANAWRRGPDAAVTGSTNSVVEFDFRPASTIPEGTTRFGVIEVLYHDNQCRHLIFVSQGYGTVRMGSNDWMMGNLYSNGTEVDNPLMEGSMFKYGNADFGLRARNNYSMDRPDREAGPFKDTSSTILYWAQRRYNGSGYTTPDESHKYESYPSTFGAVPADIKKGFTDPGLSRSSKDNGTYRVATYADYKELLDTDRFGTLFGVLYGEEMGYTKTSDADRYTDAGDPSGMRGCFIYDRVTGNHLFLPVGNTGNGRRKAYYNSNGTLRKGVLKYANRDAEMSGASLVHPRPLMYDIYRKPGALYWFCQYATEGSTRHFALDINYFTYLVNIFDTQIIYYYGSSSDSTLKMFKSGSFTRPDATWAEENSDAAFVRRIRI